MRMKCLVLLFLLLPVLALASGSSVAAHHSRSVSGVDLKAMVQSATPLSVGNTVTGNINGGDKKSFEMVMTADEFAGITVEQKGILLSVAIFDSSGARIKLMDNPSGAHGPIYLSMIAPASGTFRVDVISTEDWANPGTFDITLNTRRPQTPDDATRVQAEANFAKARDLVESASYEQGVAEYDRALALWRNLNDKHWEALTQFAAGSAYRRGGKRKEASDRFIEALKVPNEQFETNDWRLKASTLNDLGFNYSVLGEPEKAFSTLRQALDLYAAHSDRRGQASALNNLALTHLSSGDYYPALPLLQQALIFREAEKDSRGAINVRNNLGAVFDAIGEPHQALDYYLKALSGWQEIDRVKPLTDPTNLATALNNVGIAHDKLGDASVALDYYQQSLGKYKASDPNRAATLDNIGELYAALGENQRAKEYYTLALNFWDSLEKPNVNLKANLMIHMGQYYFTQGDLSQAQRLFQQAYDLTTNPARKADALTHIGAILMLQHNPSSAVDVFNRAVGIQVELKNRRGEAIARQKRGEAYALLGQTFEAGEEFGRALSLWRLVKDPRGEAATLHSIAKMELDQQKFRDAVNHSDEAIKIVESLRTRVSNRQLRISYFANQENYYAVNIDLNMRLYKATRDKTFLAAALEASERARARSLIEVLAEVRTTAPQGINPELLKREQELQRRVRAKSEAQTKLLSSKHSDSDANSMARDLVELFREYEDVRDQIRSTGSKYSQLTQPQPLVVTEIQKLLDDDTMLIEYVLGEERSYAWAVSHGAIDGVVLPGRLEIEAAANRVIRALTRRDRNSPGETLQQRRSRWEQLDSELATASSSLGQMVLDPLAPLLRGKRLAIVGDGVLQFVPFAALLTTQKTDNSAATPTPEPRPLISDYEIISLASASVLAVQRNVLAGRKPAPQAAAVFANAVFDPRDPRVRAVMNQSKKDGDPSKKERSANTQVSSKLTVPSENLSPELTRALDDVGLDRISWLPYSRDEAAFIEKAVGKADTFMALGFDASRATITGKELSRYRILHFATHGIVDLENPQLSGIILSLVDQNGMSQDGYIRLHDIYNLNLLAELVVLSACETGVGKQIKGEGLVTLTRGFMYAGAARVIASLWKVDDLATSELMKRFYNEMFTNKRKDADALRAAQLSMSKDKRWRSPYYWAGFVLQGDWR